jgi:ribonuclease P protein component
MPDAPAADDVAEVARARPGRLRASGEIRHVVERGKRHREGRVVLYVAAGEQGTRAAFVCGRRVGTAVVRNRARRLMREALRAHAPRINGGFDIVLVAQPQIAGATWGDVLSDVGRALGHAGLIAS